MHVVFDNVPFKSHVYRARIVRTPCEARVTNGLGAMNYRIMTRSTTIIQRRMRKQADGKAHTKNDMSGGSSYGLQAWEKTIECNKASSPLQREQVVGCKRGADGGDHRRTKTGGIRGNNDDAHAQNACTGLGTAAAAADVRKV